MRHIWQTRRQHTNYGYIAGIVGSFIGDRDGEGDLPAFQCHRIIHRLWYGQVSRGLIFSTGRAWGVRP